MNPELECKAFADNYITNGGSLQYVIIGFLLKTVDNMKIYLINSNFKFKFISHDDMPYHERSK